MIKDVGKACHALWVVAGGVESEVFGSWFYNAIMPADFTPIGAMNNEVRYVLFRSVTTIKIRLPTTAFCVHKRGL